MPEHRRGDHAGASPLPAWLSGAPRSFLEIFALCGFAVAQPVLDVMGHSPDYFLFRQAERRQIIFLAVAISVVPAAVLWAAETAVGLLGPAARRAASIVIRAGLLGIIGLQVLQSVAGLQGAPLLAASGVVGVVGVPMLLSYRTVGLWLRYLIPAPVVFAVLFLAFSPVSDLVWHTGQATATAGTGDPETPVVVLFLDELPLSSLLNSQGQIDARLFPNFARLAQGSSWFRNTTAAAAFTPYALPAMLSGRSTQQPLVPTAAQFPNTLFTLLGGSHDLVAYETVTALCPQRVCETGEVGPGGRRILLKDAANVWQGIMSPSETRSDVVGSLQEETVKERQRRYGGAGQLLQPQSVDDTTFRFGWLNENQPARFSDWVATLDGDRRPTFWFLHLLLPHTPFHYLPSGLQYADRWFGEDQPGGWTSQTWPPLLAEQRHLLQTVYTDALLGQVLDRLQATGLYDRSLLVVTADHGISFQPGDQRRGTEHDPTGVGWVPFFIKAPGQQTGQASDANVQTIDLVPTVADILGIQIPWETGGISAVGPDQRPDGTKPLYDGEQIVTLRADQWFPKVLRGTASRIARPELGPQGLFAVGPYADLVGTRVDDHRNADARGAQATVDGLDAYANVDSTGGVVPALVSGRIEDPGVAQAPYSVAIAVNGTIGGVSEVFQEGDTADRFAAMVSDSLFVPGQNQLDLYLVTRAGGGITLYPVETES